MPTHSAFAASCWGKACNNTSPITTGCAANSVVLSSAPIYAYGTEFFKIGTIQFRHSFSCSTSWAKIIPNSSTNGYIYSYGFLKKQGEATRYYEKNEKGIITTNQVYDPISTTRWMVCGGIGASERGTGLHYFITCTASTFGY